MFRAILLTAENTVENIIVTDQYFLDKSEKKWVYADDYPSAVIGEPLPPPVETPPTMDPTTALAELVIDQEYRLLMLELEVEI